MASLAPAGNGAAVAVFAKAPVEGAVKTRLVPLLGARAAARLHADLVRRAIATAREASTGPVTLWCAPDTEHAFFAECSRSFAVGLREQSGRDLGERMAHALDSMLARGPGIVIGADCPALEALDLRHAAAALAGHDAVFQPAEDGGYVLVGLARAVPGLFDGIAWGGDSVMDATRARLRAAGASWRELPPRWDVDRPEDYRRLAGSGLLPGVPP